MIRDRGGDPRVSELHEERPARAEEDSCFSIDLPDGRAWPEDAFDGTGGIGPDQFKASVQLSSGDDQVGAHFGSVLLGEGPPRSS
jgi:hypothetical protein